MRDKVVFRLMKHARVIPDEENTIIGFVKSVVVMDTYRGPGTNTIPGVGLWIKFQGRDEHVIATLMPADVKKLMEDLDRVTAGQRSDG